jgi:hypothetical protein
MAGGKYLVTFRSGCAGFFDLLNNGGAGNWGGFRSGCTANLIAADGVLNAPDYNRTCGCGYQNVSSLALTHMPEVEYWTYSALPTPGRIGFNFGAPGDRRARNGTLWCEAPLAVTDRYGGTNLVVFTPAQPQTFLHHSSRVSGPDELKWVAASGVIGVRSARLPLLGVSPNKSLQVRLIFCEVEKHQPGERVFEVALDGVAIIRELDIIKETGGPMRVLSKEFKQLKPRNPGYLEITFVPKAGEPLICGVELVEGEP